jgi:hypothetical protein
MKKQHVISLLILFFFFACKKEEINDDTTPEPTAPRLVFKIKLDPNQPRLDNFGQPAPIPANHGAQTPNFNKISAHYIELIPNAFVQVGDGEVVFLGQETTAGGDVATDFDQAIVKQNGEVFFSLPLSDVATGSYEFARVSLTYQNYDVSFKAYNTEMTGTVASFVGFNTFINSHTIKTESLTVNANKLQGYWAWETHPNALVQSPIVSSGQAPGTTVPNPLSATSPIPAGSCLVTGQFPSNLVITGNETQDIVVELSFSINNSFEWSDALQNNIFEPLDGDTVVDMGIRGLIPTVLL